MNNLKLPKTLFERIGVVSVGIQHYFNENGFTEITKNDKSIWNNASFVIAFLVESGICSLDDQVHFQLGFRHFYEDENEGLVCDIWIREGISFYCKQLIYHFLLNLYNNLS